MRPQKDRLSIYSKRFVYLSGSRIPCSPFPGGRAMCLAESNPSVFRIPSLFSFHLLRMY